MPTKIDFLIAKMSAFEKTLEKLDNKTKSMQVPTELAKNFNLLLEEITAESPVAAPELPKPIDLNEGIYQTSFTDVSYVGLEIMVGQVVAVLGVLKAGQ